MCLSLNLLAHMAALSEIYVVLRLMGFNIGVVGALIFEALTKLVNVVGLINPGNVGTYEGGNVLIARMFGLGADTGMVVAVARRIRAIFWASIGAAMPGRAHEAQEAPAHLRTTARSRGKLEGTAFAGTPAGLALCGPFTCSYYRSR